MRKQFKSILVDSEKLNELHLQYLWNEGKLDEKQLIDINRSPIKIIFPGWYNRSSGPDFLDARIIIGEHEFFGDVEIHLKESSWIEHGHSSDQRYNRVILHVFLHKCSQRAQNTLGVQISSLSLERYFTPISDNDFPVNKQSKIIDLPGACGLKISSNLSSNIKKLIVSAAEQRLVSKSKQFQSTSAEMAFDQLENQLFINICRSLGYSSNSITFTNLATTFPYSSLRPLIQAIHRKTRIEVLGRWLGYLGFLGQIKPEEVHDELRREWLSLINSWEIIKQNQTYQIQKVSLKGRPFNHPVRRIVGLYYHLEHLQFKGLFKSWLYFIQESDQILCQKKAVTTRILQQLELMFPQPEWDSFSGFPNNLNHSEKSPRFIGKARQLIILVNAVIPFFLHWARMNNKKDLERTLLNLFLVLPAEGKNNKTRFMEKRLQLDQKGIKIRKNLSYHQGLIQIHDDFCRSFYEGCYNCSFLDLL